MIAVVNVAGLALIAFIVWWFWLSRSGLTAKDAKERQEE
jgi:plastocyanin domain-containing protein